MCYANFSGCRSKISIAREMPFSTIGFLFSVITSLSAEHTWSADNGKASRGKLCDDYVVPSAGAVANQEFPDVVPANNKPDMRGVREQRHISGAGLAGGYSGQVYANVPIAIAGQPGVAQRPVDHAGAV